MIRFALLLFMSLAVSSQAVAKKTYSDKDGQRLEFDSFSGSDLWGTKGNPIKAHGILYLPKNASKDTKVPLVIKMKMKMSFSRRSSKIWTGK